MMGWSQIERRWVFLETFEQDICEKVERLRAYDHKAFARMLKAEPRGVLRVEMCRN
jgi:hypothetical protein